LDALVHTLVFRLPLEGEIPPYSTDTSWAGQVKAKIKADHQKSVITGKTRIRSKPYFARYETNPSDATEVVGDSFPLIICRLALLLALKEGND
jgi:hypothetical protein